MRAGQAEYHLEALDEIGVRAWWTQSPTGTSHDTLIESVTIEFGDSGQFVEISMSPLQAKYLAEEITKELAVMLKLAG